MLSEYDVITMYGLSDDVDLNTIEETLKLENDFVARIGYLDNNGRAAETIYFTDKEEYINEIKDRYEVGAPINSKQIKGNDREIGRELERSLF